MGRQAPAHCPLQGRRHGVLACAQHSLHSVCASLAHVVSGHGEQDGVVAVTETLLAGQRVQASPVAGRP